MNTITFKISKKQRIPTAPDPKPKEITGLGDVVAVVAEPIKAAGIKYGPDWLKKYLENCNCAERKKYLNEHFPLK